MRKLQSALLRGPWARQGIHCMWPMTTQWIQLAHQLVQPEKWLHWSWGPALKITCATLLWHSKTSCGGGLGKWLGFQSVKFWHEVHCCIPSLTLTLFLQWPQSFLNWVTLNLPKFNHNHKVALSTKKCLYLPFLTKVHCVLSWGLIIVLNAYSSHVTHAAVTKETRVRIQFETKRHESFPVVQSRFCA